MRSRLPITLLLCLPLVSSCAPEMLSNVAEEEQYELVSELSRRMIATLDHGAEVLENGGDAASITADLEAVAEDIEACEERGPDLTQDQQADLFQELGADMATAMVRFEAALEGLEPGQRAPLEAVLQRLFE